MRSTRPVRGTALSAAGAGVAPPRGRCTTAATPREPGAPTAVTGPGADSRMSCDLDGAGGMPARKPSRARIERAADATTLTRWRRGRYGRCRHDLEGQQLAADTGYTTGSVRAQCGLAIPSDATSGTTRRRRRCWPRHISPTAHPWPTATASVSHTWMLRAGVRWNRVQGTGWRRHGTGCCAGQGAGGPYCCRAVPVTGRGNDRPAAGPGTRTSSGPRICRAGWSCLECAGHGRKGDRYRPVRRRAEAGPCWRGPGATHGLTRTRRWTAAADLPLSAAAQSAAGHGVRTPRSRRRSTVPPAPPARPGPCRGRAVAAPTVELF